MKYISIIHPEWLQESTEEAERLFRSINLQLVPEKLVGIFLVNVCLRLLRSVTDSDEKILELLQQHMKERKF